MLRIQKVSKFFGGLKATDRVDLELEPREIVGLIGPNGAGKTTLVNLICGFLPVDEGKIVLNGQDITNKGSDFVARQGIARTFQVEKSFKDLTVLENITIGALMRESSVREAIAKASRIAEKFKLADQKDLLAGSLTIQSRKLLEFARAYATNPKIIILDEVMAGLTAREIDEQLALIQEIIKEGASFLIIEHIMQVIMSISNRIVVLQEGAKIAEGSPREIINNPLVIEAYLGKGDETA